MRPPLGAALLLAIAAAACGPADEPADAPAETPAETPADTPAGPADLAGSATVVLRVGRKRYFLARFL